MALNHQLEVTNPYRENGRNALESVGNTEASGAIQVEQQRAIAETMAAMRVAKMFPRDRVAAMDRILNECQREALAEAALYSYARGGSDITGPSIRLAEAIAQNWGNMVSGTRELSQKNGASEVETFAWDLETNTKEIKVFAVKHERHTRNGVTKLTDPRDVYELVANQGSRRRRACILAVIPGDVIETAVKQCEETLRAKADTSPDAIKKMLAHWETIGVTRSMIEIKIQRRIEAITPANIVSLRKIFMSIKDGIGVVSDYFQAEESGTAAKPAVSRAASVKDKLKPAQDAESESAKQAIIEAGGGLESGDDPFEMTARELVGAA